MASVLCWVFSPLRSFKRERGGVPADLGCLLGVGGVVKFFRAHGGCLGSRTDEGRGYLR
jgi:hypothetical protein